MGEKRTATQLAIRDKQEGRDGGMFDREREREREGCRKEEKRRWIGKGKERGEIGREKASVHAQEFHT